MCSKTSVLFSCIQIEGFIQRYMHCVLKCSLYSRCSCLRTEACQSGPDPEILNNKPEQEHHARWGHGTHRDTLTSFCFFFHFISYQISVDYQIIIDFQIYNFSNPSTVQHDCHKKVPGSSEEETFEGVLTQNCTEQARKRIEISN